MKETPTIIGIDGGASKVSAHVISTSDNGNSFTLEQHNSVKEYRNYSDFQADFTPVDLPTQLAENNDNNLQLTATELSQAQAYYHALVDSVADIIELTKSKSAIIGIGMPGVKTADLLGIAAMANGPRMPKFAEEIEQRLDNAKIILAEPISKLGSDADYCGIGEEYAENGAFRNVDNAYYLGGGTGVADALKLNGKLTFFDECKPWIAKTWEMLNREGKSMEKFCSANGIQSIFSDFSGILQSKLNSEGIYLEQILELADSGDESALKTWQSVSKNLSDLIFERITTIYNGWQNDFSFLNPNKPQLLSDHKYQNTLLDEIVIGQRLGNLFTNSLAEEYLIKPLLINLYTSINQSDLLGTKAKAHYLNSGNFNQNLIAISKLREAPALGAGIDAYINF